MARIETDPNYNAPTFSRATAATDLFKKEDVQALAAAMSTHVHDNAGKGLSVAPAAGSIPGSALADNSITSAKIVDGTITYGDIAAGAGGVQQQLGQYLGIPTFSTATTGSWVATTVTCSVTVSGGLHRIEVFTSITHSAAAGFYLTGIGIDGPPTYNGSAVRSPGVNYEVPISYTLYMSLAAGAHSVTLYVLNTTAGTLAISNQANSGLSLTEQRR